MMSLLVRSFVRLFACLLAVCDIRNGRMKTSRLERTKIRGEENRRSTSTDRELLVFCLPVSRSSCLGRSAPWE